MELDFQSDVYNTDFKTVKKMKMFRKNAFLFYLEFISYFVFHRYGYKKMENKWEVIYHGSIKIIRSVEKRGCAFDVKGLKNIRDLDHPVIFVSNHMSMMETMVLFYLVL